MEQVLNANDAALKDAPVLHKREECAGSMVQRSNDAVVKDDVDAAIIGDLDETYSRDFLRALHIKEFMLNSIFVFIIVGEQ